MTERQFTSIINKSFRSWGGFSYKIPDMPFNFGNQTRFNIVRCFDGFSVFNNQVWFWEAKLSKGIKGFNGNKILREGQQKALLDISKNIGMGFIYPVLFYCCYESRKMKRIYIFDIDYLIDNFFAKKQLENKYKYIEAEKGLFNVNLFRHNINK